jgi:hypothetical protein
MSYPCQLELQLNTDFGIFTVQRAVNFPFVPYVGLRLCEVRWDESEDEVEHVLWNVKSGRFELILGQYNMHETEAEDPKLDLATLKDWFKDWAEVHDWEKSR